jgi:cytochrome c oxidase cbb3-type subunit III
MRPYKVFLLSTALVFGSLISNAQEVADAAVKAPAEPERSFTEILGLPTDPVLIALVSVMVALFLVLLFLTRTFRSLDIAIYGKRVTEKEPAMSWKNVVSTMNEAVPVEEEHSILTDHEYDGIRELDNNLPLWWRYLFYGTIAFSFIYIFRYHIFKTGDLPIAEYDKQIAQAEVDKEVMRKSNAANVDESTVVLLADESAIAAGGKIFGDNCKACHGGAGEGGVGPNLTDEYWIHGGGIKNVFKTIKFGVPEKGMISWQAQLKPQQIQQVASYILSLQGSKPANAKAPQGDIYKDEQTGAAVDSAAVAVK